MERYLPGLAEVWTRTLGDPRICVAVLDGPVHFSHPCFDGANLKQLQSLGSAHDAQGPALAHGTHVTSLIFGQPDSPVRGVAPKCRGVIIPVYRERADGSGIYCSQLDLARAISLAVAVGAQVINISGGQYDPTGQPEFELARVLKLCAQHNVLVVAAAGNNGCPCLQVPGAAPSVLVVGAMDAQGKPLEISNWGDAYRTHGLLAPGDQIEGAVPGGGTAAHRGTSFATALVSGVAALMMSLQIRGGRDADAPAVRRALLTGVVGCEEQPFTPCQRLLAGRLEVTRSFHLLHQGELPAMSDQNKIPELASYEHTEVRRAPEDVPPAPCAREPAAAAPCPRCGTAQSQPLVYALGLLKLDFGTEARYDAFVQRGVEHPSDSSELLAFLDKNTYEVLGLTWTLMQESTPIYAILPEGPFAAETYGCLREFLRDQLGKKISQVSIPGRLAGSTHLLNGQEVPIIRPDLRGMYSWSTPKLIEAVLGVRPESAAEIEKYESRVKDITRFLDRIYYELRNLGLSPQERAINYTATNLHQVARVFKDAIDENLKLDKIGVERSAICRPGSSCWDVRLTLFDPTNREERAKEVYRLTVDVSETIPVTVGEVRHWAAY